MQTQTTPKTVRLIYRGYGVTLGIECADDHRQIAAAKRECPVADAIRGEWFEVTASQYSNEIMDARFENGEWCQ